MVHETQNTDFRLEATDGSALDLRHPAVVAAQYGIERAVLASFETEEVPLRERLDTLLSQSEAITDTYELREVVQGEKTVGYEVHLAQERPVIGGSWVLFDLDDTVVAYTQTKTTRLDAFERFLVRQGLQLDRTQTDVLMELADRFSRWDENGQEMYHLPAHMRALGWMVNILRDGGEFGYPSEIHRTIKGQGDFVNVRDTIAERLTRITQRGEPQEGDPFYFNGDHLVNTNLKVESTEAVFAPMIEPREYTDALEAMRLIATSSETGPLANVGIMTYGEPHFQLMKTLKVMERAIRSGEPLPITSIFLTTVSKGEFTEALLCRASDAGQAYRDPLFNLARHEIVLVDDSPAELLDFRRRNSQVYARYPVVLQTVLSRRVGTKNLAKQAPPTEVQYHFPTFDDQFSIGAGNRLRDDVNFALLQAGFENQPGERAFHGVHTFAWTEQYDRQVAVAWEEKKRMKRSS